jgi:glutamate carboxypeptidase
MASRCLPGTTAGLMSATSADGGGSASWAGPRGPEDAGDLRDADDLGGGRSRRRADGPPPDDRAVDDDAVEDARVVEGGAGSGGGGTRDADLAAQAGLTRQAGAGSIDLAGLAALAESDLARILRRTAALVGIDSGSHDLNGIDAVTGLLAGYLEEFGCTARFVPLPDRALFLDASLDLGEGPTVMILGHADTVWPNGTAEQWPFTNDGEYVRGPGAGDMKCALAMAVSACELAVREGFTGRIRFVVVPDEELSSGSSRPLIEAVGRESDVCLTLEGGSAGGGVIAARGAVGALLAKAQGRTAHCTEPGGASALSALAPLVAPLEALTDQEAGIICSVGILRSGTARQVVPGEAELHVDLRAGDDEAMQNLVKAAVHLVEAAATEGVQIDTEVTLRPALPEHVAEPVAALAERLRTEAGLPFRRITEKGGSDGSFVAALGVPTLDGLGPIATEQCSRREAVLVDSIVPRTALIAGLLLNAAEAADTIPREPRRSQPC